MPERHPLEPLVEQHPLVGGAPVVAGDQRPETLLLDPDIAEISPLRGVEAEQFGFCARFIGRERQIKFAAAPGAFDFRRRLEVMDLTGVRTQLMFPGSIGLYAVSFYFRAEQFPDMFKSIQGDRKGYARKLINAHNDFCL